MITRIVKLSIESHKIEEFIKIFESKKSNISNFAGCTKLNLLYDPVRPNILYTISEWKTENHLQEYLDSGFFDDTWATVKKLFVDKPEAWSLKEVSD